MANVITDANFDELIKSGKPVVVDFWAEWCGPCRMISPIIEELAHEYEEKALIGKLNVDENQEITSQYGIRSIPTILFFKNGELFDKLVGAVSKSVIEEKINALF
ncbi:MAG: thioredoxin [Dysgonamonadaceae bacterium]|jgi:thioredoxin 1|nr:thioredoxin [Dysgonamonadaceae bacterium]